MTDEATPLTAEGRVLLDQIAPAPKDDAQELHRRSAEGRRRLYAEAIRSVEDAARQPAPSEGLRRLAETVVYVYCYDTAPFQDGLEAAIDALRAALARQEAPSEYQRQRDDLDQRITTFLDKNLPPAPSEGLRETALERVYEAAHALIGVTTHANVSGPAYEERKDYYALLRKQLADPALARQEVTEPSRYVTTEGPLTDANGDELERGAPDYAGQ